MAFASFPIDELGLSQYHSNACERANLPTASHLLLLASSDLSRKLRHPSLQPTAALLRDVALSIRPSIATVVDWLRPGVDAEGNIEDGEREGGDWLGTGDEGFDMALGGGVRVGSLTEIAGESASGKSHLSLSLAISAQLPSLTRTPGASILLTTEREIPSDRLVQLAKSMLLRHQPDSLLPAAVLTDVDEEQQQTVRPLPSVRGVKGVLDNVHTSVCKSVEQLDTLLSFKIPSMLEACRSSDRSGVLLKRDLVLSPPHAQETTTNGISGAGGGKLPIRLLIIDSITALLRGTETAYSSSAKGLTERSRQLCLIADRLKALAVEYEIAVVVINQVSDVFSRLPPPPSLPNSTPPPSSASFGLSQAYGAGYGYGQGGDDPPMGYAQQARFFSGQSRGLAKEASLGIVWANAVNTRVMLSRTGRRRMLSVEALLEDQATRRKRARRSGLRRQSSEEEGEQGVEEDMSTEARVGLEVEEDKATLIRRLHVVFSPFAPSGTVDYAITPSGVHSLKGSYKIVEAGVTGGGRSRATEADEGPVADGAAVAGSLEESEMQGREDEFGGDEVFDDFGELPAEFWEDEQGLLGKEEEPEGQVSAADRPAEADDGG